jgi:hypothetical protein
MPLQLFEVSKLEDPARVSAAREPTHAGAVPQEACKVGFAPPGRSGVHLLGGPILFDGNLLHSSVFEAESFSQQGGIALVQRPQILALEGP